MGSMGTISETGFGWLTPVLSYLMACVGGALGLRATLRAVHAADRRSRRNWLAAAAVATGTGIWTMHFVAMLGFTVVGSQVRYNVPLTLLSLLVAIAVVGAGVFIVTRGGGSTVSLIGGGIATGLGVAAMHYIGMFAVRIDGTVHYASWEVGASILIAAIAATAALWASEASEMAPLPQFHTPTGTDTTATPHTRSSGSHPAACSSRASSTERSEVMPRSLDGGAGTARDCAPRSISARMSGVGPGSVPRLRLTRAAPWASAARPGRSP